MTSKGRGSLCKIISARRVSSTFRGEKKKGKTREIDRRINVKFDVE